MSLPPSLVVLTDRRACEERGRSLTSTVAEAVAGGARAVLLREKDLSPADRLLLAADLLRVLEPAGAVLGVASDVELARRLGLGWTHLSAGDPRPDRVEATEATNGPSPRLAFGRSCHDEAQVRVAAREGAAYVTVSPVYASRSKPGYGPPLGLEALGRLTRLRPLLPVYALGGIEPGRVGPCLAAGARGVAVMGAVMAAPDPRRSVQELMKEVPQ